ncbi:inactive tyrosine-protein kinase 7a isoform X1 [Neoarius graeffei]|uniref:inactive tyrosine-protein kinase 7a isoform X1 n=1 Tax=Neoarius graeffei TaxID=443677 RepID=UPI00298CBA82|nr:inactive tyrosine-protein kinase 7a isoform X1 [Neoarius graeffei]
MTWWMKEKAHFQGSWTHTAAAAVCTIITLLSQVLCVHSASFHFTKEPKSQDALHGRSAMLRCEVNDPGGITYSWLHNGQPVSDSERRFQEGGNLKFTAIDRTLDSGTFQCVATKNMTGEEERTSEANFNIKWLESGGVMLQSPALETEIESSSSVTLRCNIDGHPRTQQARIALYLESLMDRLSGTWKCLPTNRWYRDGVFLAEKSHKINNKERTLTLPSASPDDNGVYYCCAKNAAGQVCSSINFTLNIIDKSYPQPVVKPEDLVVLRNEEAHFHCQFTAEPQPTVEWYHENELISNKSRVFLLNNGSLFISQVKQRNTGRYRCVAQGLRGLPVSLEAFLRIAEIEDMQPRQFRVFTADSLERVSCQPPRGHPEPEVRWEWAGQRVPTEGRVFQEGLDLVFSPTRAEDSGIYTCIALNKAGERKQELMVTVASPPEWVQKPDIESQLQEGHAGYLHCYTHATPDPVVTWYRNMQPVSAEDARFKQFSNGTLRINSVEVYDAHVYNCESKNEAGKLKASAKVTVLERLKFTPTPRSLQCQELDKEGSLQCSAKGRLPPTILWRKTDGSELPAWVEQNGGTLLFSKVTRADAGNYTCVASNSLQGEIRAVVQLTVAVYVAFKLKPENTTVYQGHTAVLHCQATGDPSPFIQWKKKDKFLESNKSRFQTMPNGSLVIHDVSTEDTGSYTCIAGNSCNIAHTSAELYVVEKPVQPSLADDERAPYKMIQTVGLSVGAAVAYIIVVLGLMFYCKQRRKAKRLQKSQDKEEPEMECLNGGAVQQNGQTTAEIQEDMLLNAMPSTGNNKRHSTQDKLQFPRASLTAITTLGKGEFGEVLLAKVKTSEDEEETAVLVKSLQAKDEQVQSDFRKECEMFAKLSHQNITRLLGVCREAEPYYMILEYTDMGDLKQYLNISKSKDEKVKVHPLGTKQKVSVCLQVARGMEHLSNQRFVHRDLAARNCLISAKRQVKVSALGLSKDVYNSEYYHYRQAWIPLRWLPSESVFEDDFSTKTDVWSFGVLMWEVFSFGELPYADLTDDKVLEGLQAGTLKLSLPHSCPSRIYKLMLRCWASSPKDRASFSDIVTALSDLPSESKV